MTPAIRSRKVVCRLWKSGLAQFLFDVEKGKFHFSRSCFSADAVVGVVHAPLFWNRYRLHTALVSTETHGRALMNINYRDRGEKPYRDTVGGFKKDGGNGVSIFLLLRFLHFAVAHFLLEMWRSILLFFFDNYFTVTNNSVVIPTRSTSLLIDRRQLGLTINRPHLAFRLTAML
jgi:hypothetical protein